MHASTCAVRQSTRFQASQVFGGCWSPLLAGALQPSPLDDLAFSRKPRPVDFQPYSLVSPQHWQQQHTPLAPKGVMTV